MRSYDGKTVFLGIDVHKKTYAVTAICDGQVVKKDTLPAEASVLINYCKKFFVNAVIESAYETGFCGFHLHRELEKHGIKNRVVHAAGIEIAAGDKVKTDKRDSLKLAIQLSVGRLKGIHVPSKEKEEARMLTRLRESIVEHRKRIGCQLKSLLFTQGFIPHYDDRVVSEKWVRELNTEKMSAEFYYVVKKYCQLWLELTGTIKEIEQQMKLQAQEDKALEEVYRSVPGIGCVGARVLANELGDMLRFENERQIFSYTGFTPSEHSSGGHIRQGHISRQGSGFIRKILVQAAWKAISKDRSLGEIYERIAHRAGGKRAIIGVARRLIGRIRACFKKGCLYEVREELNTVSMPVNV